MGIQEKESFGLLTRTSPNIKHEEVGLLHSREGGSYMLHWKLAKKLGGKHHKKFQRCNTTEIRSQIIQPQNDTEDEKQELQDEYTIDNLKLPLSNQGTLNRLILMVAMLQLSSI